MNIDTIINNTDLIITQQQSQMQQQQERQQLKTASCCCVLLLFDLPIGSVINLDCESIVLQRNDFIGFHFNDNNNNNNHYDDDDDNDSTTSLHFVTIRAASSVAAQQQQQQQQQISTTVGFFIDTTMQPYYVYQYDPYTEEVGIYNKTSSKYDIHNLLQQIQLGQISTHRLVPYNSIITPVKFKLWNTLSNYITKIDFLQQHRNIIIGNKIVPSSYNDDNDNESTNNNGNNNYKCFDGFTIRYPYIPIITTTSSTTTMKNILVRHTKHNGTKQFLLYNYNKSPIERTKLFTSSNPSTIILEYLIQHVYNNNVDNILTDIQLSFILFMNMNCYTSFIHWRDVISMLCYVEKDGMYKYHINLYQPFIELLIIQLETIDDIDEFINNEMSDNDDRQDNISLLSALQTLLISTKQIINSSEHKNISLEYKTSYTKLLQLLQKKLNIDSNNNNNSYLYNHIDDNNETDNICSRSNAKKENINNNNIIEQSTIMDVDDDNDNITNCGYHNYCENNLYENDDDDGPVIVPNEEIEASIERSSILLQQRHKFHHDGSSSSHHQHDDIVDQEDDPYKIIIKEQYPILYAAMNSSSYTDDVLMVCARALDEANDVSLVREAAAYLQQVEAKK